MQQLLDFCRMMLDYFVRYADIAIRFFTTEFDIKLGNVEFFNVTPIDLLVEVFFTVIIVKLVAEFIS